ncbi:VIT1/CCC1 transporter family protein [Cellulomonas alba]|uniref:VIT1/CCC1 transporter family protein n=1 Tax=Cellulomonas alba TaxID=3053467 RepID=A0ABT7SF57_9CELL|nr:VIT1/CCC1 transporter family protein [Cellulomonas alba]MDM7854828.1 VIT1/CCC1 transporter family protein [Cellulomonas alba]
MDGAEPDEDPGREQARRELLIDVNDGLIAAAGMVEGVARAGAPTGVVLLSAIAAAAVGAAIVGGMRFAESAGERDARDAIIEAERRRIANDPAAELDELTAIYAAKGLDPQTARRVAEELSARDALAAQLDAEYRLDALSTTSPARAALRACGAFVAGAMLPLLVGTVARPAVRVSVTAAVVLLALVASAMLAARSGRVSPVRAVLRTVGVGALAMLITIGLGGLLDLGSAEVEL